MKQQLRGASNVARQQSPALPSCRTARPFGAPVSHAKRNRRSIVMAAGATSSTHLKLFSPSKINLFLRVIRRREDGYHDLASLFHVIDLGDDMAFELLPETASKDMLVCSDPTIPSDDSNLVIKALNLYRRKTGTSRFFKVQLDKKVPHGAGLGGGSGNAATTLWGANRLLGGPASDVELLQWSGKIGSDISVFFSQGAAYCTGRGEVVEDVSPPLPLSTPLLLVKPPVGLSTPRIFKSLDLNRRSTADPRQLLQGMTAAGTAGTALPQELCVNDLEQPAFDNLPELAALKARLQGEGRACCPGLGAVFMTGSGSTIVGVGSDSAPAFLQESQYKAMAHDLLGTGCHMRSLSPQDMFVSPARLITRQPDAWYKPSGLWSAPQAAPAAAAVGSAAK